MNREKRENKELSISELLEILWSRKLLIILLALICGGAMFASAYFSVPTYKSSGVLYVSNMLIDEEEQSTSVKSTNIQASRLLVTTYMEILKTDDFLSLVGEELGGKYSTAQLKSMISMSSINETELLSVSVVSTDPQDSCDIVSAVLNNAPETLLRIFESGSVKTVNHPKVSTSPIGKGTVNKTLIGTVGGAILGCVLAIALRFFDNRVRKASDLTERYDLSVLGEIRR